MFEFGRDLRKLFTQARESDDLSWMELIGADLVEAEARAQTTDAGRTSCARPFEAWLRASAFWREHARRTGRAASLAKADAATLDSARAATNDDDVARARIEASEILLLRFDLCGGRDFLAGALAGLSELPASRKATTDSLAAGLHARLKAREARLSTRPEDLMDAAALLDAAIHAGGRTPCAIIDEIRMDRAALGLEAGVLRRDARLLDQAGRDLRTLVESASPDYRPVTRARALALCGMGMRALATLAHDEMAMQQGQTLFDAAADQFTPDHSPLDWVSIQILRADEQTPLLALAQAQALSEGGGLVLGALAREARFAREARLAEAASDVTALQALTRILHRRLEHGADDISPVDWIADQIALAHVATATARLDASSTGAARMTLVEASATATEHGVPVLADRAERALAAL